MNNINKENITTLGGVLVETLLGTEAETAFNEAFEVIVESENYDGEDVAKVVDEYKNKYMPNVELKEQLSESESDVQKKHGAGDVYSSESDFLQALEYADWKGGDVKAEGNVDLYKSSDGISTIGAWDNGLMSGVVFTTPMKENVQPTQMETLMEAMDDEEIQMVSNGTGVENANNTFAALKEFKGGNKEIYESLDINLKGAIDKILEPLIEAIAKPFEKTMTVKSHNYHQWADNVEGLTIEEGSGNDGIYRGWNTASNVPVFVYNSATEEFSTNENDPEAVPMTEAVTGYEINQKVKVGDKDATIIYQDGNVYGYETADGKQDVFTSGDETVKLTESFGTSVKSYEITEQPDTLKRDTFGGIFSHDAGDTLNVMEVKKHGDIRVEINGRSHVINKYDLERMTGVNYRELEKELEQFKMAESANYSGDIDGARIAEIAEKIEAEDWFKDGVSQLDIEKFILKMGLGIAGEKMPEYLKQVVTALNKTNPSIEVLTEGRQGADDDFEKAILKHVGLSPNSGVTAEELSDMDSGIEKTDIDGKSTLIKVNDNGTASYKILTESKSADDIHTVDGNITQQMKLFVGQAGDGGVSMEALHGQFPRTDEKDIEMALSSFKTKENNGMISLVEGDSRIDGMVKNWNDDGKAFSKLDNDDSEFFTKIGVDSDSVGTTSQTGNDIVYYDTERVDSDLRPIK